MRSTSHLWYGIATQSKNEKRRSNVHLKVHTSLCQSNLKVFGLCSLRYFPIVLEIMIAGQGVPLSMSYSSALEASLALYQGARYQEAYDLISGEASSPDAIPAMIYYLRYSFACRAGNHDLAMDIFREAVEDKGFWYSSGYLDDDDLEPLRIRPEFERLVTICRERDRTAQHDAVSEFELVLPRVSRNGKKPALVVALHGNQLNTSTTEREWCRDSLSDCLVALPQSSHAVCTGGYSWVDPSIASQEVVSHLDGIMQKEIADPARVILGGFSAGGRVVLHLLLKGKVRAKGIILLGPWLPDLVAMEPMIPNLRSTGVKVYLICGDKDKDCYDSTNGLAELLEASEVPFRYRIVSGMGHCYPVDFDEELSKARSFIFGR